MKRRKQRREAQGSARRLPADVIDVTSAGKARHQVTWRPAEKMKMGGWFAEEKLLPGCAKMIWVPSTYAAGRHGVK